MVDISESTLRQASPGILEALEYSRRWRILIWINAALMIVFLLGVVVMVNIIGREHRSRFNWTRDRVEELSPDTLARLRSIKREVNVLCNPVLYGVFQYDKSLPEAWRLVENMLGEFQRRNELIELNVLKGAGTASLPPWMQEFGELEPNTIYILCRDADQKVHKRMFVIRDLYHGNMQTGEIEDFQAEVRLISAMYTMAVARRKVVYYTIGHGENPVEDASGGGISELLRHLRHRDNVEFKRLNFDVDHQVPQDADAVFIAGPKRDFPLRHLDALKEYLETGGRMFVALEPRSAAAVPGLSQFLAAWGARPGRGVVHDPQSSYPNRPWWLRVRNFERHTINQEFHGAYVDVPMCMSVSPVALPGDRLTAAALLRSGKESFEDRNGNGKRDAVLDERGLEDPERGEPTSEHVLAVAVEGKAVKAPRFAERPTSKLVVWGSVVALTNENHMGVLGMNEVGIAYCLNTFRWLLDMEQVITPGSRRSFKVVPVDLGAKGESVIRHLSWFVIPSLGVLLGVVAWWFRRK